MSDTDHSRPDASVEETTDGEPPNKDATPESSPTKEEITEIVTQVRALSSTDAERQTTDQFSQKVRNLVGRDHEVTQTELRYKPYYQFDATLRKKIFRGEDDVYRGAIIVDSLTGVARPLLKDQVETTTEEVPVAKVLEPEIDAKTAHSRANRNRIQVQQRESGKIDLGEDADLVYKPLWLVELNGGDVKVVDATNGQVFGDNLL